MADLTEILKERENNYGDFLGHSNVTQAIKRAMLSNGVKWPQLLTDQKECLEMIAHKIGRILNGNPDYADSWDDIAGYATLVANRLKGNAKT